MTGTPKGDPPLVFAHNFLPCNKLIISFPGSILWYAVCYRIMVHWKVQRTWGEKNMRGDYHGR
jgi:hypothetical protein